MLTMDDLLTLGMTLLKVLLVVLPLLLAVAYLTLAERRVIGLIQDRIGPNRVGPRGLLQPIADMVKLFFKEIVVPTNSNRYLFILAPILAIAPALAAWAVVPFADGVVLANLNVGVLYILAMTSLGVYGIIIAGWGSNSKYAFLGSLRASAQIVSYEIAMGCALVGVVMAAGSLNLTEIVHAQKGNILHWYWLPLFPLCVIHWISAVAETNRSPFDLAEGESEIVAGFHVEYGGMGFGAFFLAEYANMILMSLLMTLFYFGGWMSPFVGIPYAEQALAWIPGIVWLFAKTSVFLFLYIWFRATFPRYRYDQLMRLGWKVFIPITLIWIVFIGFMIKFHVGPWFA